MSTTVVLNAKKLLEHAQRIVSDGKAVVDLPNDLDAIQKNELWKEWTTSTGKPFESFQKAITAKQPYGLGIGQYHGWITASQAWALCSGYGKVRAELLRLAVDDVSPIAKHGSNQHRKTGDSNSTSCSRGAEYLLRRIKAAADGGCEKAQNAMEQLRSGAWTSVSKAAIAAGIHKKPSMLQTLLKAWHKATEAERSEFIAKIKNPTRGN